MNDFKVKDISEHQFGRQEIEIAETEIEFILRVNNFEKLTSS